jgi:hypothetical protein
MKSMLEEFRAAMLADADESLTCTMCQARGMELCNLTWHVADVAGFAVANARTHRIQAMQRASMDEARP